MRQCREYKLFISDLKRNGKIDGNAFFFCRGGALMLWCCRAISWNCRIDSIELNICSQWQINQANNLMLKLKFNLTLVWQMKRYWLDRVRMNEKESGRPSSAEAYGSRWTRGKKRERGGRGRQSLLVQWIRMIAALWATIKLFVASYWYFNGIPMKWSQSLRFVIQNAKEHNQSGSHQMF